jgi:hypothetical protein
MDKQYADTVRLLLNVAPEVFDNKDIASEYERAFVGMRSNFQRCAENSKI